MREKENFLAFLFKSLHASLQRIEFFFTSGSAALHASLYGPCSKIESSFMRLIYLQHGDMWKCVQCRIQYILCVNKSFTLKY